MTYEAFSDLIQDINRRQVLNGTIEGEDGQKLASFYQYWHNYLDATPAVLTVINKLLGGMAKALYMMTLSLEHVFNNLFKLFGLFGYLTDSKTVIGQFYQSFQTLGLVIFVLVLIVSVMAGVFTKPVKYKEAVLTFLLVTLVTSILPMTLTTVATTLAQDAVTIQSTNGKGESNYSSLAIQPLKNNVVDLKVLVDKNFDTKLFPMDDHGYIMPVVDGAIPLNKITDDVSLKDSVDFVTQLDFGSSYGVTNAKYLEDWESTSKKEGLKGLFQHQLNANRDGVVSMNERSPLKALEAVYPRYKVNWTAVFVQYGILLVLLISMSIKFVKSVVDILIQGIISPIQGYSSLSRKKYLELLKTIGGALAGIVFEVMIMRITLEICRDFPGLSLSTVEQFSGAFTTGMSGWEQFLACSVVYLGIFMAAMQGVTMIERWLGVSTGHSETAQQLIRAMMVGQAFASGAAGVGSLALGAGKMGVQAVKKTPSAIAGGIATTAGTFGGITDIWKDQGTADTVKGGISSGIDAATAMANQALGHPTQKAKQSHDKAYEALKHQKGTKDANKQGQQNEPPHGTPQQNQPHQEGEGGITDPTLPTAIIQEQGSASQSDQVLSSPLFQSTEGGVTDPTLPQGLTQTQENPSPFNQSPSSALSQSKEAVISDPLSKPKVSSGLGHLAKSKQGLTQANQYLNQQSHIKGAESDEEE
ncbi:pLS20_p028 family conjugation system transmembrane protein [Streptococcus canis]|uniref:pLS20_p028 family conjugation system transmembrane protein n=1 Tax=Streptococcus canis TaxID=1329 RepID=UPI002F96B3AB